ncbi:MAG: phosphoribosylanthranilate isomerase [Rhodoglobus sp.]
MTWVKICGLRSRDAVDAAVESGADAIGFVFAARSPRFIEPTELVNLIAGIPNSVETVAVVRDQPIELVIEWARIAGVTTVQLHGSEPESDAELLRAAGFAVIRAISIDDYRQRASGLSGDRLLIDAIEPGAGLRFDGSLLLDAPPTAPWILAGGLDPDTVAAAIVGLKPTGVDVSSGVESSRGVKSPDLIRAFVLAAKAGLRRSA